jgi:hypothetical protein
LKQAQTLPADGKATASEGVSPEHVAAALKALAESGN